MSPLAPEVLLVTGTDTDVGKTVATAALAVRLTGEGYAVHVVKPAQTGMVPGEPGDVHEAGRLAGLPPERLHEGARLPEPLAPTTAARRAGMTVPTVAEQARSVLDLAEPGVAVLVEGAGGVLVGLDNDGATILDLADALRVQTDRPARFVVVARSRLGTLNHTGLTTAAVRDRGHEVAGVVIGSWPVEPDLAERCNLEELAAAAGAPLLGCLPAGAGSLARDAFRAAAERALPGRVGTGATRGANCGGPTVPSA